MTVVKPAKRNTRSDPNHVDKVVLVPRQSQQEFPRMPRQYVDPTDSVHEETVPLSRGAKVVIKPRLKIPPMSPPPETVCRFAQIEKAVLVPKTCKANDFSYLQSATVTQESPKPDDIPEPKTEHYISPASLRITPVKQEAKAPNNHRVSPKFNPIPQPQVTDSYISTTALKITPISKSVNYIKPVCSKTSPVNHAMNYIPIAELKITPTQRETIASISTVSSDPSAKLQPQATENSIRQEPISSINPKSSEITPQPQILASSINPVAKTQPLQASPSKTSQVFSQVPQTTEKSSQTSLIQKLKSKVSYPINGITKSCKQLFKIPSLSCSS